MKEKNNYFSDNYRSYLQKAFEARVQKNSSYSWRAFARDLGLANSTLIEVIQGKCGLSPKSVERIIATLSLSSAQADHFSDLVAMEHSRSPQMREAAALRVQGRLKYTPQTIDLDQFKVISEWYHLALLELLPLPGMQQDISFIAQRLGISEEEVSGAFNRMERLGLIVRKDEGYAATDSYSFSGGTIPSKAIRDFHHQILQKAIAALEQQSMEVRENSSTIFSIDTEDIPIAKKKLLQFRREFSAEFAQKENKNGVYCLGIHFFSLLNDR